MLLCEDYTAEQAKIIVEAKEHGEDKKKRFYLEGMFLQGESRNRNGRTYPLMEIKKAINEINGRIKEGYHVLGELDHPPELDIKLERVSHVIENMWLKDQDGYGRLRILSETPCGKVAEGLLKEGIKPGVSSRGQGMVSEHTGQVSDFEIVTIDLVATPSAVGAYPTAIYEQLERLRSGKNLHDVATDLVAESGDRSLRLAQKHFERELMRFITDLGISRRI